jgi:hypothetical protein
MTVSSAPELVLVDELVGRGWGRVALSCLIRDSEEWFERVGVVELCAIQGIRKKPM